MEPICKCTGRLQPILAGSASAKASPGSPKFPHVPNPLAPGILSLDHPKKLKEPFCVWFQGFVLCLKNPGCPSGRCTSGGRGTSIPQRWKVLVNCCFCWPLRSPRTPQLDWGVHKNPILNKQDFWLVATQVFFIFTPTWGNDPIWNGLKPQTRF